MRITRAVTALGLLTTAPTWGATPRPAPADTGRARIVQIVAHEDDDLLFLNPDLATGLAARIDNLTVYLTAGENRADATPDPAAYARHRQAGVRAAYAGMAGVSGCDPAAVGDGGCWLEQTDRQLVGAGRKYVQRYALHDVPSVRLAFLNLPDDADDRYPSGVGGGGTLRRLLEDPGLGTDTLDLGGRDRPAEAYRYRAADVLDVLTALLDESGATLVRSQDDAPLRLWPGLPDHPDHVATGLLAARAVAAYGRRSNPHVMLDHYRDYNIAQRPPNLAPDEAAAKRHLFSDVYRPFDDLLPADLPADGSYARWQQSEYARNPRSTGAVATDGDGRPHAFATQGGSLWEWYEDAEGGHGPVGRGGPDGPLAAGLSAVRTGGGRVAVFGRRADTGEIVGLVPRGDGWSWESLGNPNASGGPLAALTVSSPVAAADADGRLRVFVANAGGGVSARTQTGPDGGWADGWTDLGGTLVQGPPATGTTRDGRIELFAPTTDGILHWYQPSPGATFATDPDFPRAAPGSGLSVGTDAAGRLSVAFRQPGTADLLLLSQRTPGGPWESTPLTIHSHGGTGEPALTTATDGRQLIATRNHAGSLAVTTRPAPDQPFGPWTDLGPLVTGVPMATPTPDGGITLLALAPDGTLLTRHLGGDS